MINEETNIRQKTWDAAVRGNWDAVKRYIEQEPSMIRVKGDFTEIVDGEKFCTWRALPLFHLASSRCCDVDVLKTLVSLGAVINKKYFPRKCDFVQVGQTALHMAAADNPNVEVSEYLISQGADINEEDIYGWTPLCYAAQGNPNVEILKYFVSQGADVDVKTCDDTTPLYWAASSNSNVEVLRYLVSQGADVNATMHGDWSVLDVADSREKRRFLRSAGAKSAKKSGKMRERPM